MKKIIKRKIRISTRTRDFIDFINHEFYSHDKHNAFFEFTMEHLPTENIIALFYFQKTKRYLEKRATVEGNTFTIEFDTNLITTDETVIGFIYFEKVVQSADVHQFSFGVKVSEIDKMQDVPIQEESTKRIVSLDDIVTKAELKELFKTIERTGGSTPIDTSNFATTKAVEAIEERVRTIENTEYAKKNEIPKINTEDFATKKDLEDLRTNQPTVDTSDLSRRISTLEGKTDNFISGVSVSKEGSNVTLTYTYVDGQSKNVSFTDSDTINLAYDDSPLREKLKNLENRPQIDLTKLVTKDELPNLIQHQSLTEYAKKTDIVTPELELHENILQIKGGNYVTLPIPNNTSSQLKGSGSPEGKVIANPGDTYVNTSVSLGDYLYYKERNPDRNTGWSVLFGQKGVNINLYTGDKIRLDRTNYIINASINDMTINLDKLKAGNASDFAQTGKHVTIRFTPSKRFDARESVLPAGFRPNGNFQVPAYGSSGEEIGVFKFEKTYGVVKLILFNTNLADITQDKLRGINSGLIMYNTQEAWFTKLP